MQCEQKALRYLLQAQGPAELGGHLCVTLVTGAV